MLTNGACPEYFKGVYTEGSEVLSASSSEGATP
jgi:hypothetical protein